MSNVEIAGAELQGFALTQKKRWCRSGPGNMCRIRENVELQGRRIRGILLYAIFGRFREIRILNTRG